MSINNVDNPAMTAPLYVGIGTPFLAAYFLGSEGLGSALLLILDFSMAYVRFVLGFMLLMAMTGRPELAGMVSLFAL
jgi:hypothetical protein